MYVWRHKSRRDRRDGALTALTTLPQNALQDLRTVESDTRAFEEVHRCDLENIEINKYKRFAHDDLLTYFDTRNGKDEVSAVGAVLLDIRAEKERMEKEAKAHTDDNDESVSVLSSSSLAALDKKKSNAEKKKLQKAANDKAVGKPATDGETAPEPSQPEAPATELAAKSKTHTSSATNTPPDKPDPMSIEFILSQPPNTLDAPQKMKLKVHQVFGMFDADASDSIDREEFRNCIDELCIPMDDDELTAAMKEVDDDSSGSINFEEFFGWYQGHAEAASKGKMMGGMALKFARAMRNYNGESIREEAKRLIIACAEREAEERARRLFRMSRPPRYICEVCGESFQRSSDMGLHVANGETIHPEWKKEQAATLVRQDPVLRVINGEEARKYRVRRLIHSQHLYDPELNGINYDGVTVWKNKSRPFNSDPDDKRGDQLRRGQLVEGFDAKLGKRAGFVQSGFVIRDQRPGEGRTRNHMAHDPLQLPDVLLRLYMDKQLHVTSAVRMRAKKKNLPLPIDTISNTFLCDPASGQSKATVSFHWSSLVYQGAYVHGEFNGYKGESMSSQGYVDANGASEFVLERYLSPGVYQYYFLIDGLHQVDIKKPTIGRGKHRRNIVTVCNPSVLGGQGGPYTDGRLSSKNIDAVAAYGGDITNLLMNSTVDMAKKSSRMSSRKSRPTTTDGAHALNAMLVPKSANSNSTSLEGLSKSWNSHGGAKLNQILLVHNMVCDDGAWALGQAMMDNYRVTELDLSSNLITSDGLRNLSRMFLVNGSITKLFLNMNAIGYDGARYFADALILNDDLRLTELEMAQNALGDDGAEALCRGLAGCGTITRLNLDGNRIHDDGAKALGDMLAHNKVITTLNLAYNRIEKDGSKALAEALLKNCTLQRLSLKANPLGPGGLEAIGTMLRLNDSIHSLNVSYAQVMRNAQVEGLFELCRALRVNRTLTVLDLSGNDMGEPEMRKILAALFDLDNPSIWSRQRNIALVELEMHDNHIDGEWLQNDHEVSRNGFPKLPSIPLYCKQNAELCKTLDEDQQIEMKHWLQKKRILRKNQENRKAERKLELERRVRAQQQEVDDSVLSVTEQEVADKAALKRQKKLLKKSGAVKKNDVSADGLSADDRKQIQRRERKLEMASGERRIREEDDDASVSSLGSVDFLKGGMIGGNQLGHYNGSMGDDVSIVSSVTGGGSMVFAGGVFGSGDDSSVVTGSNSLITRNPFAGADDKSSLDGSSLGPSIDSEFLASLRDSLFGESSDSVSRPKEELKFRNSSMYSITETNTLGASCASQSLADGDSAMVLSATTGTTASFSQDSAASYLVKRYEEEKKEKEMGDDLSLSSSVSSLQAGSVVTFSKQGMLPLPPPGVTREQHALAQKPPKAMKYYAREEGEWRKDRSWVSQRSLDRTARRLAEEAARLAQIQRQKEEDEFIDAKVKIKEEHVESYLKKDDGVALIQAVIAELKELRHDEEAKSEEELRKLRRADMVEKKDRWAEARLRYDVKKVFDIFDGDASGQIGCDEFADLMKELCIPMNRKDLKELVKTLDADGSGELDFEEFFEWYKAREKARKAEKEREGMMEGFQSLKLKAMNAINAGMGSTAKMEAKRILLSNDVKDVITLARHEFRVKRKPQFECMECYKAFIDKKEKKEHDKNVEELHFNHKLMHDRATARHKLVDLARYRVTKGEAYPKFFVYPEEAPDHEEQQVMDRPETETGRPLGVISKNTTVKALGRSGEKGTGDWLRIAFHGFEEGWILERTRRPFKLHLVPMGSKEDTDDIKEEKRKMKLALTGKTAEQVEKEEKEVLGEAGEAGEAGEEGEMEEVEEEVVDEETGEVTKVKKRRKKKKKEEEEKKEVVWPKKGHLEFFPISKYYGLAPKLHSGTELNVRAQPELESPVIGHIVGVETVRCNAVYGDWIQVTYKNYDNAWMLIRNKVHELLKPVDRDISERAALSKKSPWDQTFDYVLNKPGPDAEIHVTAGSRDALGMKAFEEKLAESKSTSTKAQMGLQDQLTDEVA